MNNVGTCGWHYVLRTVIYFPSENVKEGSAFVPLGFAIALYFCGKHIIFQGSFVLTKISLEDENLSVNL